MRQPHRLRVARAAAVATSLVTTLAAPSAGAQELRLAWQEAAPGVWKATVGTPERASLLAAAGATPRRDALARMRAAPFPLPRAELRAERRDGKTVLRFPLGAAEQLYGLGLNFRTVNQRGTVKELHVDHYGGADNGRTHAPVPFYVSSAGYGVLVDAARYVTVYAGTAVRRDSPHPPPVKDRNTDRTWSAQPTSDAVEMVVPAAGATVYLFAGPTPLDAVRRYNLLSGGGALPPKWGLGFLHRVPTLFTAEQVLAEVDQFAARGYPLDVVGLEPGWQSAAYPGTFVWDRTRFPDAPGFLRAMQSRGVGVNLWINPYVAPSSPLYDVLRPLSGSHTVWTGIVPDVTLPRARDALTAHFRREHLALGVSGYKIDEVDGYDRWLWPDHATFPSGLSGEQMRQLYGLALQRATADLFRAEGRRTWGLARGSNAGAASLPYVIYNDSYSHQEFVTALANSGFVGVLWTPEVRSSRTGEEWLRRMQSVCFSPLAMLNAWADGTKPWSFPEVAGAVRDVMRLRVRLLPYLYTAFARYHDDGTPPFRGMQLVDGFRVSPDERAGAATSTDNPYAVATRRDVKDQYMVGDDLLVAPMFAGDTARAVVLPAGTWYDFHTGARVGGGEIVTVRPGLERIPVFVRDGAVIPLLADAERRQVPRPGETADLEVRHYGTAPGAFRLYDDDGTTFAHERGAFSWTTLAVVRDAGGALRGVAPTPPAGQPWSYGRVTWRMMTAQQPSAQPTAQQPAPQDAPDMAWWRESMRTREQRVAWWREARFGMFIHWGVYSHLGGMWNGAPVPGYAEHIQRTRTIPAAVYRDSAAARFDPTSFDADAWMRAAKGAGMGYLIITAKHHDGLAMYDSDVGDWDVVQATPWRRDPMRELRDAARRHGVRFGFYYSHAWDWGDPEAPGNDWEHDNPGGDRLLHGGREWWTASPAQVAKARRYVDRKAIPQVRELLRKYDPDILWFDAPVKMPPEENLRVLRAAREAKPDVVINSRVVQPVPGGPPGGFGDYLSTVDRPAELRHFAGDWEGIPTTNESYGWHRADSTHKPPEHFVRLLAKSAARGGNLLLNVGPMGDGRIDPRDTLILAGVGRWMATNGASIRGTTRTPLPPQEWGESTRRGDRLYLHVFDWPRDGRLRVAGLRSDVVRASLLARPGAPLAARRTGPSDVELRVPAASPDPWDAVVVIDLAAPIAADSARRVARDASTRLHVFDGALAGQGVGYSDGKRNNDVVIGWSRANGGVEWPVRVMERGRWRVSLEYAKAAPDTTGGGAFELAVGDGRLAVRPAPTGAGTRFEVRDVGALVLERGRHTLRVRATADGASALRLRRVILTPIPD